MPIKNIAVSVASEAGSLVTIKYAIYLARILEAKLTAIYVINEEILRELLRHNVFVETEAREYERDLEEQGQRFLERVKKMAEMKKIQCECCLLRGSVHKEVTNKTRELNAELLIMGELKELRSRKETYYDEGERIFRDAPCVVVVVKDPQKVDQLYNEV